MTLQYLGQNLSRPDAFDKITGAATYLDDIRLPGLLHMAVLLPEDAHAILRSIDVTEAKKCPGVVQVVIGRDCPSRHGIDFRDRQPLAVDRVRHAGEPVAAVIAEDVRQARLAAHKIRVIPMDEWQWRMEQSLFTRRLARKSIPPAGIIFPEPTLLIIRC